MTNQTVITPEQAARAEEWRKGAEAFQRVMRGESGLGAFDKLWRGIGELPAGVFEYVSDLLKKIEAENES